MTYHARTNPDKIAVVNSSGQKISYGNLEGVSTRIANSIVCLAEDAGLSPNVPVVVYGHKDPLMVACFVGCLKSGHPYVPIDMHSVPLDRAVGIVEQIGRTVVLEVESRGGAQGTNFRSLLGWRTTSQPKVAYVLVELRLSFCSRLKRGTLIRTDKFPVKTLLTSFSLLAQQVHLRAYKSPAVASTVSVDGL